MEWCKSHAASTKMVIEFSEKQDLLGNVLLNQLHNWENCWMNFWVKKSSDTPITLNTNPASSIFTGPSQPLVPI